MSDFDQQDVLPPRKQAQSDFDQADVVAPSAGSDFAPQDVIQAGSDFAESDVIKTSQSDYEKLREESTPGIVESITNSPLLMSKTISDADIATIAKQRGVDPGELRRWLPWLGGVPEQESIGDVGAGIASTAGQMMLGVPQKIAKKTQTPEMEAALDDIQELAQARKSLGRSAIEMVDVLPGVGTGMKLAQKAAVTAGLGAVQGASIARGGEEGGGAAAGAVMGAGAAGAIHGAGKLMQKRAVAKTDAMQKRVDDVVQKGGIDIQEDVQREVEKAARADRLIRDRIFEDRAIGDEGRELIARTYNPESLERRLTEGTEENLALRKRVFEKNPDIAGNAVDSVMRQTAINEIANDIINTQINKLAADAGIAVEKDGIAALRQWAGQGATSGQGTEWANEKMQRMQRTNHAVRVIGSRGFSTTGDNTASRLADWLSDAQYVLRSYDEKYKGIGLESAHKEVNTGLNKMSFAREEAKAKLRNVFRMIKQSGADDTAVEGAGLIQKIENPGLWQSMTPDESRVAKQFSEFYEDRLNQVNKAAVQAGMPPLAIKPRVGPNGEKIYVPSQLTDGMKLQDIMVDRTNKLLADANKQFGTTYRDLAQLSPEQYNSIINAIPEHKETMQFLRTLSKSDSSAPADLSRALKETFMGAGGNAKLETVARAALERDDVIPMWARETNMYKLADKWITNTLRHVYLRRGLDQLGSSLSMLEAMNAGREAKYVRNLITDINGTRQGTVAEAVRSVQQKFMHHMDKWAATTKSPAERHIANTLKSIPVMLQELTKQVYPNFLGMNPRSLLMNATQTFTKTMPEFGSSYGASLAMRGAMQSVRGGVVNGFKNSVRELEKYGLMPAKYVAGGEPYLAEGIARSGGAQVAGNTLRKMADASMWAYGKAEEANRSIALGMSKMMVHDLAQGSAQAASTLRKFPTSVQRGVEAAAGDQEELTRIIATHIINSTQYQYNRASMSEMGRTLGPLFSAFSKWPSATLGQVVEGYRTGGMAGSGRLAQQLVAPWVLLETADQIINYTAGEPTDRRNKLLSKSGLSQAAPIGNLRGYLPEGALGVGTGDFWSPPAVDTALKLFASGQGNSSSNISKAIDNGIYAFAPGGAGGWIRFLTDDLVTLYTGQKPQGSTFMERTKSGLDQINREF